VKSLIKTRRELGEDLVLAPERWLAIDTGRGVPLGELVAERRERAEPDDVVVDTTHARDGIFDLAAALRATGDAKSAKKRAEEGDLVVSRLRPYLRQIAYVHPRACAFVAPRALALSTEFYVLAPREGSLAFLVPFLLGARIQQRLAAAQEGGHHPRVPRASLLALRIPHALVARRSEVSRRILAKLDAVYRAAADWDRILNDP